mmetsp:Transcript_17610/g.43940  ORF Transcript_17610/g.43940 Transcript_17610/m.43940 type:complete len:92 (-) Transcript_17610:1335-1610(-)
MTVIPSKAMLCVISFLIFATRCGYATDDDIDDLNPRRQERFGRLVYDTIEIDKRRGQRAIQVLDILDMPMLSMSMSMSTTESDGNRKGRRK